MVTTLKTTACVEHSLDYPAGLNVFKVTDSFSVLNREVGGGWVGGVYEKKDRFGEEKKDITLTVC